MALPYLTLICFFFLRVHWFGKVFSVLPVKETLGPSNQIIAKKQDIIQEDNALE